MVPCVRVAQACVRCDAPDVLTSALGRANEAGLEMSYAAVHGALQHWAEAREMYKVEQVCDQNGGACCGV
jgi:hypothetical protein